jgi:hypothetical protein
MKGFYFAVSIFFSVLILIIAFENINALLQKWLFFFGTFGQYDGFFMVLGFSFMGAIIGVFTTLFLSQIQKTDDEEPGAETF